MKLHIVNTGLFCLVVGLLNIPVQAQEDGASLFETHCSLCHVTRENQPALGPELPALRQMTPEHILDVMENGVMKSQADERSRPQRHLLAEYLSGKPFGAALPPPIPQSAYCAANTSAFNQNPTGPAWNGWGVSTANARYQTTEAAGITAETVSRLKLKWAFGYPGATSGGTQPVVVGDRLYVATAEGDVYALDANTGCVHWLFEAEASVRSAITVSKVGGSDKLQAFFGDQAANVYSVDAETGKLVWKQKVETHPRAVITGAPTLYNDRLYVPVSSREESQVNDPKYTCCQFRGSVVALDANDGKQLWKTYTIDEPAHLLGKNSIGTPLWGPSGVPVWVAPTIDAKRKVLYIGTGNNYSVPATAYSDAVLALDLDTGKIRWASQVEADDIWNSSCRSNGKDPFVCPEPDAPDTDFANSPVLTQVNGRDILVAGNKLGKVYAFDPDKQGKILWQTSTGKGMASGGIMWGLAVDGTNAYAANNYFNKKEPEATGGVTALELATGRIVWTVPALSCEGRDPCKPSHNAAVTVIPGVVFSGTQDGRLRALSTKDGKSLWEFDTHREFDTINGVKANGGSMANAGATVVNGMVYVNSGYSHHGAIIPGNVLLAFDLP